MGAGHLEHGLVGCSAEQDDGQPGQGREGQAQADGQEEDHDGEEAEVKVTGLEGVK